MTRLEYIDRASDRLLETVLDWSSTVVPRKSPEAEGVEEKCTDRKSKGKMWVKPFYITKWAKKKGYGSS